MITFLLLFAVLLLVGMPIAFAVGVSTVVFFLLSDIPLEIVVQKMVGSTQSFALLAVPFFVLAGNLMNQTGITRRLIAFSSLMIGHLRGGLAQVSVLLSCMMGGVSGSATAYAAMQARILGPDMEKRGYARGFNAAILAVGGLVTAIIPPSLGLILYGVTGEVSIGRLFMAGIIPGILVTIGLMIAVDRLAKVRNYVPEHNRPPQLKDVACGFLENIWALIFPVLLIVGIRFGIFTPSEAGAFAVVYALFIGIFVYRELTPGKFVESLRQTAKDLAVIMFIIICSNAFGYAVIIDKLPQNLAYLISEVTQNKYAIFLLIMGFVFIVGMFMEATANVLLLTPIFMPIIQQAGIDPVHFGVIYMTLITLGGMTPPVGVTMYTTCSILDCPVDNYIRESLPFIFTVVLILVALVFLPQLVLFLPNLVYGG